MQTERTCSKCGEDANLFCRMCQLPYCWEHPCHHLQVAQESNSYSKRLDREIEEDENRGVRNNITNDTESQSGRAFLHQGSNQTSNLLQTTLEPLQTYSEEELTQELDYHRTQARRIRNELERRALFASGVAPNDYKQLFQARFERDKLSRSRKANRKPRVHSKSIQQATSILLDEIRSGVITVEQIEQLFGPKDKIRT